MTDLRFALAPASPIDDVGRLWRRLEERGEGSFFVSWTWIGTWLHCLPGHIRPHLLTATRDGEVVGAAVVVSRRERRYGVLNVRQLHFNVTGDTALDCIMIEHNGFVGCAEADREPWPAFLRWFAGQAEADELVVPGIADGAIGEPPRDLRLLHATGKVAGFACGLPPGGRDAILAGFSANTRQQLHRSLRDCEALGELRIEMARSADEALAWFAQLKALHVAYWTKRGRRHAFDHPFFETFHSALVERGATDGSVRLRRVSAGSAVLGYLYDFERNGRLYAYQSGFDDSHSLLRPGYVAHALAMEQSAREGARAYDYLGGDNRLKRSFGKQAYTLGWHRFSRPRPGLRLQAAAARVMSGLRSKQSVEHAAGAQALEL
ncbi:MAG: GNAT family N-acetyltransferase [Rhizomicrobium sp.]